MKQVTFQGKDLHYRISGTGKRLMLVHGFGEDGRVFDSLARQLPADLCVIIPDLPGSGQSPLLAEGSMEVYAASLREIAVNEWGPNPTFTMIGHSMGGYITMAYADVYPNDLVSFGLFHSSPFADSAEKKATRKKNIEFIQTHGAAAFLDTVVPNMFAADTKNHHPQKVEILREIAHGVSAEALIQYTRAMMQRPNREEVLKKTQKPALLIGGLEDTVIEPGTFFEICTLSQIAVIHLLKKSGHSGMLEQTELCTKYIIGFMNNFTEL